MYVVSDGGRTCEVLSWNYPGEQKEIHEKFQSEFTGTRSGLLSDILTISGEQSRS
jgi:hypothetical protein